MKLLPAFIITSFILAGCSSGSKVYYELPVEFRFPEKKAEFINKYSQWFTGKTIFIDPGHGGQDRRSKGPDGLVVEADVNLSVALFLRDFLIQGGAAVKMSRDKDTTVDLKKRSYMADSSGADIFISIHHNAPASADDNWTNYTSTYYHAKETDYIFEPCEKDLAKYVERDLAYAMRNSGGPGSFDGTYSDYNIYPGQGFSVLRVTKIPAILVECGFFTNPYEEKKLAISEFNKIEAWGIFRGLARYFSAGIPEIEFINPSDTIAEASQVLSFGIKDSSGIDSASIFVQLDSSKITTFSFLPDSARIDVHLYRALAGSHEIRIAAANKNGNHSFPFRKKIFVKDEVLN